MVSLLGKTAYLFHQGLECHAAVCSGLCLVYARDSVLTHVGILIALDLLDVLSITLGLHDHFHDLLEREHAILESLLRLIARLLDKRIIGGGNLYGGS